VVLVLGRAMEPPLEVGGEEGLHGGVVAAVERLVQAEHQELVALLLCLCSCWVGAEAAEGLLLQLIIPLLACCFLLLVCCGIQSNRSEVGGRPPREAGPFTFIRKRTRRRRQLRRLTIIIILWLAAEAQKRKIQNR